ncbi:WhiB family transcriptional regulator [Geodermatophilus sp. SYSU D01105]
MGRAVVPEHVLWAVPSRAADEWLALTRALERAGTVACQTGDPSPWWPERGRAARQHETALAACRRCPAVAPCLAYALAADERFGIWGGSLPEERRARRWAQA